MFRIFAIETILQGILQALEAKRGKFYQKLTSPEVQQVMYAIFKQYFALEDVTIDNDQEAQ